MAPAAMQWGSPLLAAVCFVALWVFVNWLLSYASGWAALARIYCARDEAAGIPVRLRAVHMGCQFLGQYRNVLTLWVSTQGLCLRMQFLFRINNPDLFFPWADISVTRGRRWFSDYIELKFRQAPEIPLRIYGAAAEMVCDAAGDQWPEIKMPQI